MTIVLLSYQGLMRQTRGPLMIKMINGVIHGRNIELKEDLGLSDGQQVRVQVLPIPPAPETNRLIQSAGMLADEWATDDDRILNTLRSER